MSAMSTRIDDLPGAQSNAPGLPDDIQQELNQMQDSIANSQTDPPTQIEPYESNIKADIRKRVRFTDENKDNEQSPEGIFDVIKHEINEENMLLLAVLLLASVPAWSAYIQQLLPGYTSDSWSMMLIKAGLMLVIFILAKRYLLPHIKV
ncbi:MAG: hypothetical protein EBU90_04800 [Proteobacteria bacterium]|nr:hypothetical protein [Pseudomonadota bacterium]NBP13763.1 hypothetical protein [bacterium]